MSGKITARLSLIAATLAVWGSAYAVAAHSGRLMHFLSQPSAIAMLAIGTIGLLLGRIMEPPRGRQAD